MQWFKYRVIALICASAAFLFTLWYSYDVYVDTGKQSDLPVISAPSSIVTKPANPGGMIVPYKDKDIYNSMSGRMSDSEGLHVIKNVEHSNLSRTEALTMIQKQLKRSASTESIDALPVSSPQIFYIRVAKIKSPQVFRNAVQIVYEKYPQLAKLEGKLYEDKSIFNTKYYVHLGPIKDRQVAESLCEHLRQLNKSCAVFSEQ
jgi:hypothetical protein